MKRVFTTALAGALSISMLFAGTEAKAAITEVPNEKITDEFLKEELLEKIRIDYPNAQFINLTDEELQEQQKGSLETRASALTYLEVYSAKSAQRPTTEYFSSSQLSSVYDHGGD